MEYGVPTDIVNYYSVKGRFPCAHAKHILVFEIPQRDILGQCYIHSSALHTI
jgi:hypothetical protein